MELKVRCGENLFCPTSLLNGLLRNLVNADGGKTTCAAAWVFVCFHTHSRNIALSLQVLIY